MTKNAKNVQHSDNCINHAKPISKRMCSSVDKGIKTWRQNNDFEVKKKKKEKKSNGKKFNATQTENLLKKYIIV